MLVLQALDEESVAIERKMSDIVSEFELMLPELTDADQSRAKTALDDHSASIDK